ncbi:MAG: hypothetical protein AVO34_02425 [Firmicutes bacterium ML8_F2]|jgi:hypothetical protein|nr:MAG: hypothetical protein AVO34_02425 [Firmicutes bacterium ML8_F2]
MRTDWMVVNAENMAAVAKMFKRDGFVLPSPRCFGKPIKSFNLTLQPKKEKAQAESRYPLWRLAFDKIMSLIL